MCRWFKIFLFILILKSFSASSQTYWKVENEHGDEILLTLTVNNTKNTFEAFTRKDALKDLAGIFTYTLAKAAGKLKYPEIVFIEGKSQIKKDTLLLNGDFYYFDKHFLFSSTIADSKFEGRYIDNKGRSHRLAGTKMPDAKPIKDYAAMINTTFLLTEKNIINTGWLKSDEWSDFKKKANDLKSKISDDYELAATFFWLGKKLPFAPFEINKERPRIRTSGRKNSAGFKEIKPSVVYMDGNSLPVNQREMDSIAVNMNKKRYPNLIIDLRGNSRLGMLSANILISYTASQPFTPGVCITRNWSDKNAVIPLKEEYSKLFKSFMDGDFVPGSLYKETGRYLKIIPNEKNFKGKVFVLTDSRTSRVAEILTYVMKSSKMATIVGQKTAGNSILTGNLIINGEYDLTLPDCEFFTDDGKSLNNKGVEPDISKSGDEALNYVLSII